MSHKILIIGSVPKVGNDKSIGGATVLMSNLVEYLKSNSISFYFIDTNVYYNSKFSFVLNLFHLLKKYLSYIFEVDVVMFNFSDRVTLLLFPFLSIFSILFRRKLVLRLFGGGFIDSFEKLNYLQKNFFVFILDKVHIVLVETLYLRSFFEKIVKKELKVIWYPNVRNQPIVFKVERTYLKRYVFISQIKKEKGINEILQASMLINQECLIDVYGPIVDSCYYNFEWNKYNVNYKGVIPSSDVLEVLNQYDVLLLPTYYKGEGYPGIIIEAFSLGIPVISTNWRGIPEIVNNGVNGILINSCDANALALAINNMNADNYKKLSLGARESFINKFESNKINQMVVTSLLNL